MDSVAGKKSVQVRLTVNEIRSIFAAVNTAGMLSAGRISRQPDDATQLLDAIAKLENASGIDQGEVSEWVIG